MQEIMFKLLYEKIELLEKKQEELEQQLKNIENKMCSNSSHEQRSSEKISKELNQVTRVQARKILIQNIEEKIKDKDKSLNVRVATRMEGGGVIVEGNNEDIVIHFYYSKAHREKFNEVISWNAVEKKYIFDEKYRSDIFIFNIYTDKMYYLFFSQSKLQQLLNSNDKQDQERIHFSFRISEEEEGIKIHQVRGNIIIDPKDVINNYDWLEDFMNKCD